jgi:hypothetical protein
MSERAVLVSTAHRGIFFGYTDCTEDSPEHIVLKRARMVVYHSEDSHGFIGVAAIGPGKGARISPAVARAGLRHVTSVLEMTPEAVAACEAEPWR